MGATALPIFVRSVNPVKTVADSAAHGITTGTFNFFIRWTEKGT